MKRSRKTKLIAEYLAAMARPEKIIGHAVGQGVAHQAAEYARLQALFGKSPK